MDPFEAHRPHLHAVATRILGSPAEADDALQETWIRVNRADTAEVENMGGWLTTIVSRVCLTAIVDGAAGFVATEDGTPVAVLRFTVVDGQIIAIDALAGPARVAELDLGRVLGP
jgi:DNA-directed RNA polymerase specialized sigma24 family protein